MAERRDRYGNGLESSIAPKGDGNETGYDNGRAPRGGYDGGNPMLSRLRGDDRTRFLDSYIPPNTPITPRPMGYDGDESPITPSFNRYYDGGSSVGYPPVTPRTAGYDGAESSMSFGTPRAERFDNGPTYAEARIPQAGRYDPAESSMTIGTPRTGRYGPAEGSVPTGTPRTAQFDTPGTPATMDPVATGTPRTAQYDIPGTPVTMGPHGAPAPGPYDNNKMSRGDYDPEREREQERERERENERRMMEFEKHEAERGMRPQSMEGPRRSTEYYSSSGTSTSSYLDISHNYPSKGWSFRTFFRAPSEKKPKRRKSKRVMRQSNSSSSSLDGDLAYGTGFLRYKRKKSVRSRDGRDRETIKYKSSKESLRETRPSERRPTTDAEILAVGAGLAKLARDHNKLDQKNGKKGKNGRKSESGVGSGRNGDRGFDSSRNIRYETDPNDDEGWESASDDESDSSVDSGLAFGGEAPAPTSTRRSFFGGGKKKHGPMTRKSSIVDPRLFGPQNSLNGVLDRRVGYEEVQWESSSDFGQQSYIPYPDSQDERYGSDRDRIGRTQSVASGSQASLQQVFPVPTSDPSRFDVTRRIVSENNSARPVPVPLQQPQPITLVSQSVYNEPSYVRSTSTGILKSSSNKQSLAEAAWTGVVGAALGAVFASSQKNEKNDARVDERRESRREVESVASRREDDRRERRRAEEEFSVAEGSIAKRRERSRDNRPERDEKREQPREVERIKDDTRSITSDSSRDNKRDSRRDDPDSAAEERVRRREERRQERREADRVSDRYDERRSNVESEVSAPPQPVNPFQYQVKDSPVNEPRAIHPSQEATPTVVTVDREPDFAHKSTTSNKDTPKASRTDAGRDREADEDDRSRRYRESERVLHEAERIYEETEHSTAPIDAAAIAAAAAAVGADGLRQSRTSKRRGERRTDSDDQDYKQGQESEIPEEEQHAMVMAEADRAYREIVMARKVAAEVRRSRTPSPERSVINKYEAQDEVEEPERIVTPPGMHDHKKKGPYDAPNADFKLDYIMTPRDLKAYSIPAIRYKRDHADLEGPFMIRDPDAKLPRPLLNLIQPTPTSTPSPEKQFASTRTNNSTARSEDREDDKRRVSREVESKSQEQEKKQYREQVSSQRDEKRSYDERWPDRQNIRAQGRAQGRAQEREQPREPVSSKPQEEERGRRGSRPTPAVILGPRGDVIQAADITVSSSTQSTVSKGVTWGVNETKHFEVESPTDGKEEFISPLGGPEKSETSKSGSGWGAIAAGVAGAGVGAALASSSEPARDAKVSDDRDAPKKSRSEDREQNQGSYEYRGVTVEPGNPDERPKRESPPKIGPKPATTTQSAHVPGAFDDDLEFTATVAAGLDDTGFDPNLVIDDPAFRKRDSPAGSNEFAYQGPRAETVSDLQDAPAADRGYVVGEVAETPKDWTNVSPPTEEVPSKPIRKELRRRESGQRWGGEDFTPMSEIIIEEPEQEGYFDEPPRRSKMEQRRLEREATKPPGLERDMSSFVEVDPVSPFADPQEIDTEESAETTLWNSKSSRSFQDENDPEIPISSKQKSRIRASARDLDDESPRGTNRRSLDSIQEYENEDDFDSRSLRRNNGRYDSPAGSGRIRSTKSSRSSKESLRNKFDQYDDIDPAQISLPPTSSSEENISSEEAPPKASRLDNEERSSSLPRSIMIDKEERASSLPRSIMMDKEERASSLPRSIMMDQEERSSSLPRSMVKDDGGFRRKKLSRSSTLGDLEDHEFRRPRNLNRSSTIDDLDDLKAVALAGIPEEGGDPKKSEKRIPGGLFSFFGGSRSGSKDDPRSSRDDSDDVKKKKKKRSDSLGLIGRIGSSPQPVTGLSQLTSADTNGQFTRIDSTTTSLRKDGEKQGSKSSEAKKDSFLDNAGILGAGAGLAAGAVAVVAQHHQYANAANENENENEKIEIENVEEPGQEEIVDPEISEREFRPSIDPQYGDLLPLPPSGPVSPNVDPIDYLPELPESRPTTPDSERRTPLEKTPRSRRSLQETPLKTSSPSAVPLKFVMGNRSMPSSPVASRSPQIAVPGSPNAESTIFSRPRSRPKSWDKDTKEYKPLYLLETNRRGSFVQPEEQIASLPQLPPSRNSSQPDVASLSQSGFFDKEKLDLHRPSRDPHGPLSMGATSPSSDDRAYKGSTPTANTSKKDLAPAAEFIQDSSLPLETHKLFSDVSHENQTTSADLVAHTIGAAALATASGFAIASQIPSDDKELTSSPQDIARDDQSGHDNSTLSSSESHDIAAERERALQTLSGISVSENHPIMSIEDEVEPTEEFTLSKSQKKKDRKKAKALALLSVAQDQDDVPVAQAEVRPVPTPEMESVFTPVETDVLEQFATLKPTEEESKKGKAAVEDIDADAEPEPESFLESPATVTRDDGAEAKPENVSSEQPAVIEESREIVQESVVPVEEPVEEFSSPKSKKNRKGKNVSSFEPEPETEQPADMEVQEQVPTSEDKTLIVNDKVTEPQEQVPEDSNTREIENVEEPATPAAENDTFDELATIPMTPKSKKDKKRERKKAKAAAAAAAAAAEMETAESIPIPETPIEEQAPEIKHEVAPESIPVPETPREERELDVEPESVAVPETLREESVHDVGPPNEEEKEEREQIAPKSVPAPVPETPTEEEERKQIAPESVPVPETPREESVRDIEQPNKEEREQIAPEFVPLPETPTEEEGRKQIAPESVPVSETPTEEEGRKQIAPESVLVPETPTEEVKEVAPEFVPIPEMPREESVRDIEQPNKEEREQITLESVPVPETPTEEVKEAASESIPVSETPIEERALEVETEVVSESINESSADADPETSIQQETRDIAPESIPVPEMPIQERVADVISEMAPENLEELSTLDESDAAPLEKSATTEDTADAVSMNGDFVASPESKKNQSVSLDSESQEPVMDTMTEESSLEQLSQNAVEPPQDVPQESVSKTVEEAAPEESLSKPAEEDPTEKSISEIVETATHEESISERVEAATQDAPAPAESTEDTSTPAAAAALDAEAANNEIQEPAADAESKGMLEATPALEETTQPEVSDPIVPLSPKESEKKSKKEAAEDPSSASVEPEIAIPAQESEKSTSIAELGARPATPATPWTGGAAEITRSSDKDYFPSAETVLPAAAVGASFISAELSKDDSPVQEKIESEESKRSKFLKPTTVEESLNETEKAQDVSGESASKDLEEVKPDQLSLARQLAAEFASKVQNDKKRDSAPQTPTEEINQAFEKSEQDVPIESQDVEASKTVEEEKPDVIAESTRNENQLALTKQLKERFEAASDKENKRADEPQDDELFSEAVAKDMIEPADIAVSQPESIEIAAIEPVKESEDAAIEPVNESEDAVIEPVKESEDAAIESIKESEDAAIESIKESEYAAIKPVNESEDVAIEPIKESEDAAIEPVNESEDAPIEPVESEDLVIEPVKESEDAAIEPVNESEDAAIEPVESEDLVIELVKESEDPATSPPAQVEETVEQDTAVNPESEFAPVSESSEKDMNGEKRVYQAEEIIGESISATEEATKPVRVDEVLATGQEPEIQDEALTSLQKSEVQDEALTTLQAPEVQAETPTAIQEPEVQDETPATIQESEVQDKALTTIQETEVQDKALPTIQEPEVQGEVLAIIQETEVQDKAPITLQETDVLDETPTTIQEPEVQGEALIAIQEPEVQDEAPTTLQVPEVQDETPTTIQESEVQDEALATIQESEVQDEALATIQESEVQDEAPTTIQESEVQDSDKVDIAPLDSITAETPAIPEPEHQEQEKIDSAPIESVATEPEAQIVLPEEKAEEIKEKDSVVEPTPAEPTLAEEIAASEVLDTPKSDEIIQPTTSEPAVANPGIELTLPSKKSKDKKKKQSSQSQDPVDDETKPKDISSIIQSSAAEPSSAPVEQVISVPNREPSLRPTDPLATPLTPGSSLLSGPLSARRKGVLEMVQELGWGKKRNKPAEPETPIRPVTAPETSQLPPVPETPEEMPQSTVESEPATTPSVEEEWALPVKKTKKDRNKDKGVATPEFTESLSAEPEQAETLVSQEAEIQEPEKPIPQDIEVPATPSSTVEQNDAYETAGRRSMRDKKKRSSLQSFLSEEASKAFRKPSVDDTPRLRSFSESESAFGRAAEPIVAVQTSTASAIERPTEVGESTDSLVEPAVERSVAAGVEQSSEPVVEGSIEPISDSTEPAVERISEPVIEQSVEPASEQVIEQPHEPDIERSIEPTSEQAIERPSEPITEQSVELTSEQPIEQPSEPTIERIIGPTLEQGVEQPSEPTTDRSIEPIVETIINAPVNSQDDVPATPSKKSKRDKKMKRKSLQAAALAEASEPTEGTAENVVKEPEQQSIQAESRIEKSIEPEVEPESTLEIAASIPLPSDSIPESAGNIDDLARSVEVGPESALEVAANIPLPSEPIPESATNFDELFLPVENNPEPTRNVVDNAPIPLELVSEPFPSVDEPSLPAEAATEESQAIPGAASIEAPVIIETQAEEEWALPTSKPKKSKKNKKGKGKAEVEVKEPVAREMEPEQSLSAEPVSGSIEAKHEEEPISTVEDAPEPTLEREHVPVDEVREQEPIFRGTSQEPESVSNVQEPILEVLNEQTESALEAIESSEIIPGTPEESIEEFFEAEEFAKPEVLENVVPASEIAPEPIQDFTPVSPKRSKKDRKKRKSIPATPSEERANPVEIAPAAAAMPIDPVFDVAHGTPSGPLAERTMEPANNDSQASEVRSTNIESPREFPTNDFDPRESAYVTSLNASANVDALTDSSTKDENFSTYATVQEPARASQDIDQSYQGIVEPASDRFEDVQESTHQPVLTTPLEEQQPSEYLSRDVNEVPEVDPIVSSPKKSKKDKKRRKSKAMALAEEPLAGISSEMTESAQPTTEPVINNLPDQILPGKVTVKDVPLESSVLEEQIREAEKVPIPETPRGELQRDVVPEEFRKEMETEYAALTEEPANIPIPETPAEELSRDIVAEESKEDFEEEPANIPIPETPSEELPRDLAPDTINADEQTPEDLEIQLSGVSIPETPVEEMSHEITSEDVPVEEEHTAEPTTWEEPTNIPIPESPAEELEASHEIAPEEVFGQDSAPEQVKFDEPASVPIPDTPIEEEEASRNMASDEETRTMPEDIPIPGSPVEEQAREVEPEVEARERTLEPEVAVHQDESIPREFELADRTRVTEPIVSDVASEHEVPAPAMTESTESTPFQTPEAVPADARESPLMGEDLPTLVESSSVSNEPVSETIQEPTEMTATTEPLTAVTEEALKEDVVPAVVEMKEMKEMPIEESLNVDTTPIEHEVKSMPIEELPREAPMPEEDESTSISNAKSVDTKDRESGFFSPVQEISFIPQQANLGESEITESVPAKITLDEFEAMPAQEVPREVQQQTEDEWGSVSTKRSKKDNILSASSDPEVPIVVSELPKDDLPTSEEPRELALPLDTDVPDTHTTSQIPQVENVERIVPGHDIFGKSFKEEKGKEVLRSENENGPRDVEHGERLLSSPIPMRDTTIDAEPATVSETILHAPSSNSSKHSFEQSSDSSPDLTRNASKADKRKRQATLDLATPMDDRQRTFWADEIPEAQVVRGAPVIEDIGKDDFYSHIASTTENAPISDFSRPAKKGKTGTKRRSVNIDDFRPPIGENLPKEEPMQEIKEAPAVAATVSAIATAALLASRNKRTGTEEFEEEEDSQPAKKVSRKARKRPSIDTREPSDDKFDDAAPWEEKNPRGVEEASRERYERHDNRRGNEELFVGRTIVPDQSSIDITRKPFGGLSKAAPLDTIKTRPITPPRNFTPENIATVPIIKPESPIQSPSPPSRSPPQEPRGDLPDEYLTRPSRRELKEKTSKKPKTFGAAPGHLPMSIQEALRATIVEMSNKGFVAEGSPPSSPSAQWAIRSKARSGSGVVASDLPVRREESVERRRLKAEDSNRDSAFGGDSPIPPQGGFQDTGYVRDSGVHMRDESPSVRVRAPVSSSEAAIASMSWPNVDEEAGTVDLEHSQRPKVIDELKHLSRGVDDLPSQRNSEENDPDLHKTSAIHGVHSTEGRPRGKRRSSTIQSENAEEIEKDSIRSRRLRAFPDRPQEMHDSSPVPAHRSFTPEKGILKQQAERMDSPEPEQSQIQRSEIRTPPNRTAPRPIEDKYRDLEPIKAPRTPRAGERKYSLDGTTSLAAGASIAAAGLGFASARRISQENRPGSAQSQRSASNISVNRMRTPNPLDASQSPFLSNSAKTNRSFTPPLRRTARKISGDLRSLRQQGNFDPAKELDSALIDSTGSLTSTNSANPTANEGRVRSKEMADVYDGYGEGRMGSPRSPTRPHSMRRRQSMRLLELEAKLDELAAENRALNEAKAHAEHMLLSNAGAPAALVERDAQIDVLKRTLASMQDEVRRLTEVNDGLTSAAVTLGQQHNARYSTLEAQHTQAQRELQEARESRRNLEAGVDGIIQNAVQEKDKEIASLRSQLDAAKEQIRAMQRQILASKAGDSQFLVVRDEDYFDNACQQLCQHVQQWVLRFSKFSDMRACRLTSEINNDKTIDRLDNAILDGSDVDHYLADRVRRRDVFMSMTMTMIWEFIFTRYLFGMDREQRQKLKSLEKILTEVGPSSAVHQWRATTLTLLSKRESFARQKEQDTLAVVHAIMETLSEILPPPSHMEDQIEEQLKRVIREAVNLSIEMRTQRAEYMMLPPLQPEYDANGDLASKVSFNAALMNERSGDTISNEELEAQKAVVRVVLFPLVVKKGDDLGQGDEEIVVCPAQVLVAKPGRRSKGVRVFTPDQMDTENASNRSKTSFQSSMPDTNVI